MKQKSTQQKQETQNIQANPQIGPKCT